MGKKAKRRSLQLPLGADGSAPTPADVVPVQASEHVDNPNPWRGTSISPNVQAYRGPEHILITRAAKHMSILQRARKKFASGKFSKVTLHAMGAACPLAIVLANRLVQESEGRLIASCSTSTEVVVDQGDFLQGTKTKIRRKAALHIELSQQQVPFLGQAAHSRPQPDKTRSQQRSLGKRKQSTR